MSDLKRLGDDRLDDQVGDNWIIVDWAGNILNFRGYFEKPEFAAPKMFETFEDGEEYLENLLGDRYEEARGEYFVIHKDEVK